MTYNLEAKFQIDWSKLIEENGRVKKERNAAVKFRKNESEYYSWKAVEVKETT